MDSEEPMLEVLKLWAKSGVPEGTSREPRRPHSIVGHLLDTAAVAELLWDRFLAPITKRQLDEVSQGRGRDLLVLLAATHDLGKATPAFQLKAPPDQYDDLLAPAQHLGLDVGLHGRDPQWPHPHGSVVILRRLLRRHFGGQKAKSLEWLLTIVDGHHGMFGITPNANITRKHEFGQGPTWVDAQDFLAETILARTEISLNGWEITVPSRGVQLALAGFVSIADWIASSDLFPGVGLNDMSMAEARGRARRAWPTIGLQPGWNPDDLMSSAGDFEKRFGFSPRPLQRRVLESVEATPDAGLVIIEDAMGGGKTEAALGAVELLARRNGCNGATITMPTQGTTDAMYDRVASWLGAASPATPLALLHGKAMLNEHWVEALAHRHVNDVHDEYGLADDYGTPHNDPQATTAPSSWVMGRHRGLLSSAVGTVDQVLWAATRTRYVALRHAGLAGKVLVIDEVHSYDAYMGVFLAELLRWCARLGTPVVLVSATLHDDARQTLLNAWREGAGLDAETQPPEPAYPRITIASTDGDVRVFAAEQFRADLEVDVSVLPSDDPDDTAGIAQAIAHEVESGGVALGIFNTVRRAQEIWSRLKESAIPTLLIHGRFTAAERAERTAKALKLMSSPDQRPERLVVIATQIAEQSFDVDADILFTDVAPIDLFIQRIGRIHRHERPTDQRPPHLRHPRVIVTGMTWSDGIPVFSPSFANEDHPIYQRLPLLGCAEQLQTPSTWRIPSEIPERINRAYIRPWASPTSWENLAETAEIEERALHEEQRARAKTWRLDEDIHSDVASLNKLHARGTTTTDDGKRAVVRDADDSLEVSLVVRGNEGYATLTGKPLGPRGERASDPHIARQILGDSIRLRWQPGIEKVTPLPEWKGLPLLGFMPVLVLNQDRRASLVDGRCLRYDAELGILQEKWAGHE